MFHFIQLLLIALCFVISSFTCNATEKEPEFSKPLACFGEGNRKLTIESRTPDNTSFFVSCSGLDPNENLLMMSLSEDEVLKTNISADKDGCLVFGSNPTVIGKRRGTATISIISRNGKYRPLTLSYNWGE